MEKNDYTLNYQQSILKKITRKGIIVMFKMQKEVKKQSKSGFVKVFLKRGRKRGLKMDESELRVLFDEFNLGEFQPNKDWFIEEMLASPNPLPGRAARKSWRLLASAYKRFVSSEETALISQQQAKPFQILRDKHGFVMLSESVKAGDPNSNFVCYKNGVVGHKIIGIRTLSVLVDSINIKLSKQQRLEFMANHRCSISGLNTQLEIDDRTPRKVMLERFLCNPPIFDTEMLASGRADEFFQVLTRPQNALKREVCSACLSGKDIFVPKGFRRELYKKRFDNYCYATKSCKGCFWFNPSITQDDVVKEVGNNFNKASVAPEQLLKLKAHFDSLR